jgi:NADPH2:quinone reductase
MKAIRYDHFGSPEVLTCVELPVPELQAGEVLVRVHAVGVNFFEVLMRADRCAVTPLLPMLPGVEVAGVVEKVGEGIDGTRLGTRVAVPLFALGGGGGYAEYVAVDAGYAVPIPDRLPFSGATALVVQGLTALHMVQQSSLMGKTVLVHAAAGGVGSLLTQLARRRRARRVIATAVSTAKRSLALEMGANLAIDFSAPGWETSLAGLRPDVVYDTIGGDMTRASLAVLADGGELVFAALGRFAATAEDITRMLDKNQSLRGLALLPLLGASLVPDLQSLFELAASGELRLLPGRQFPLHGAAEAYRAIESRMATGKVVLVS